MNNIRLSVIVPTHNPDPVLLGKVIDALKKQDLPLSEWELIVIDNKSDKKEAFAGIELSWHPSAKIIQEERLGLTWARVAGIQASAGEYVVFVDDDNVLDKSYLKSVIDIFRQDTLLGAIGGKISLEFETKPEAWTAEFFDKFTMRDLGNEAIRYFPDKNMHSLKEYPRCAPVAMSIQKKAVRRYITYVIENKLRSAFDRKGRSLTSGGDNDIIMTLFEEGWGVGYFPQLKITHLIPARRLTKDYLASLNRGISKTWPMVLAIHGIRPWRKIPSWTVLPRKVKAFFTYHAWRDPASYVRWQGACGHFEGLALLTRDEKIIERE